MKCLECGNYSPWHLCKICQKTFLTPQIKRRTIASGIEVVSFYAYEDIKRFLHTKHTELGYHIFHILAQNSFKPFAKHFSFEEQIAAIAIGDTVKDAYSHTAVLNSYLRGAYIKPLFGRLRARNKVSYSGKSKSFRLLNPRDFLLKNFSHKNCILVDDIVTTGTTFTEAITALKKADKDVLFCLTLADARS